MIVPWQRECLTVLDRPGVEQRACQEEDRERFPDSFRSDSRAGISTPSQSLACTRKRDICLAAFFSLFEFEIGQFF